MKVSLRDGPEGLPVVDLDAELFEDIPNEIYVSKKNRSEDSLHFLKKNIR